MLRIFRLTSLLGFLYGVNAASTIAQPAYPTFEREGIIFELRECSNTSNTDTPLKCDFLVENSQEGRRSFTIYANNSRLIDSEGNEITALTANLGNKGDESHPSTELIIGIPVKGSVTFGKSPVGEIRLVDLNCAATSENSNLYQRFNVEFPLAKQ